MYATPDRNGGWQRLSWPAVKISDGTEVRPGPAGVTPELLAAVGAVQIVDPDTTHDPATQAATRSTEPIDVDGVPTWEYTVRPLTTEELAAKVAAAEDEAERQQARQAYDTLGQYIDASSPTAAQTVGVVKLLCRVARRLIRDQYGR